MADFIQGTPPPQGPQQQQGVSPQAPVDFLNPVDQGQVAGQAAAAGQQVAPEAPPSMPQGAGMGATQQDPRNAPDDPATEEEQAQYEDLFLRVMAAVNDTRAPNETGDSPADAVIKMMSVKGKDAAAAVGTTAGLIMTQMVDMAKRQGKEYSNRIIQEVGMDLVVELIDIADVSGAIKNIPEADSEEYNKLLEMAVLEGTKLYGEWQLRTGQADRQGSMQDVQGQMQREADAGELDGWGMEELDPQLRTRIAQQMQGGGQPPAAGGQQPPAMPPQGGM